jgi:antitoxin ParD1/3/4
MATMNVSLPDPMRDWIQQRIDDGHYASVSDYVRDLIRRDQSEFGEREALISALTAAETSGTSRRSVPDIFEAVRRDLAGKQGG